SETRGTNLKEHEALQAAAARAPTDPLMQTRAVAEAARMPGSEQGQAPANPPGSTSPVPGREVLVREEGWRRSSEGHAAGSLGLVGVNLTSTPAAPTPASASAEEPSTQPRLALPRETNLADATPLADQETATPLYAGMSPTILPFDLPALESEVREF